MIFFSSVPFKAVSVVLGDLLQVLDQKGPYSRTEPVSAQNKPFKKFRTCSSRDGNNTAGSPVGGISSANCKLFWS